MSEVEQMWVKLQAKFGVNRPWGSLHPMEQQQVIQAINIILGVLHKC